MATHGKVDIVDHKKKQQCVEHEWNQCRPEHHTAAEGSDSIKAVQSKTRSDDAPQTRDL